MEIREGKIRVNRKEMREIKRMDHQQLEDKLTEAYARGHYLAARKWEQAVEETLGQTKGIGPSRKELFLERLKLKIREDGSPSA